MDYVLLSSQMLTKKYERQKRSVSLNSQTERAHTVHRVHVRDVTHASFIPSHDR